jgi:hypothetical protein
MKIYIWNENCIGAGRVDVTYDPDDLCDGDHAEFKADNEASMIDEAREYLHSHDDNSWRARSYRNILAYLNASETDDDVEVTQ